eukprot:6174604-Amphidinium_carterae.1
MINLKEPPVDWELCWVAQRPKSDAFLLNSMTQTMPPRIRLTMQCSPGGPNPSDCHCERWSGGLPSKVGVASCRLPAYSSTSA